ncbi:SOS response-associated peptidase [Nitrospirillum sp. BR 11828]|uniref:SOS response-associated peptidase n=1 Tax=Nitrospirillum sp. BR 11828 TaxID=3104325 RepID=UPI002ACAA75A|nr:SOS response-associated peptidase [Nitrospirillum sp. BR 11828]MDZ5648452.1 SOS response-associated peptidase [Nitrospirillum sp. BR 11828]
MCGRYAAVTPPQAMEALFQTLGALPNFPGRFNIAPTQSAPVVRWNAQTGERRLDLLRWGLVPSWAADLAGGAKMINARSESVTEKPTFRQAFARRRCLVPVTAFYEWRVENGVKQAYAIAPGDRDTAAFAGLWEGWKDPASGEWVRTYTILTTAANDAIGHIHHRMPVILAPDDWPAWLGETDADPSTLLGLLRPYPANETRFWAVGPRVGNVRNDDADLLAPQAAATLF